MEEKFKNWLTESGKASECSVFSESINRLSVHYSDQIGSVFDIYELEDDRELSKLNRLYSKKGKFSNIGDEQEGNVRTALEYYVKFLSHHRTIQQNKALMQVVEDFCANNSSSDLNEYRKEVQDYCEQLPSVVSSNHGIELDSPTMNFTYERDLQQLLCMQVAELFPEYQIFGGAKVGIEYPIGTRRIDVLLESISDNSLLVVELKSGMADFRVFGQISMYMELINREFCDRNVYGVIIAGQIDDSLAQATETNDSIKLMTYQVGVKLKEA